MLDIKWVRDNASKLDKMMELRGGKPVSSSLIALDDARRDVLTRSQELQARRNDISKQVGIAKSKGEDAAELFAEMKNLGPKVKELEEEERKVVADFKDALMTIPNILDDDTPEGADENDNVEVRTWGTPKKFAFEPKAHFEVGEPLGMDFETGAKLSGSRFVWNQGDMARMERALGNFMLDLQLEKGFTEVTVPFLVNDESFYGTGQLPKFAEDFFKTTNGYNLIPTAEVPLTNYARGKIFKEEELPFKFASWSACFRSEAGSAGRDTRGMIRMHQFHKVEMVQIVKPEESEAALEFMTNCAEDVLKKLNLPYRVVQLCSGDIGFGSSKTYDLEVWLPAQNTYREISSCSNCRDFQARRMNARYKNKDGKTEFVHTLNGSGLAVGRTMVAVIENYQNEDGSITVPDVLVPYMGGKTLISVGK